MNSDDASTAHIDGGSDPASHPRRESQPSDANPPDDPRELGNFKWNRYKAGNKTDSSLLDEAIEATQLAVGGEPRSSDDAGLLVNLGLRLGARILLSNNVDDLRGAIPALQRALELSPNKNSRRAERLHRLNKQLRSFFKREGVPIVLDLAITAARCAVDLTTDGHPREPNHLHHLGLSLRLRFKRNGDLDDIEQSIAAHRRAVELTPDGRADKPRYYNNLGVSLRVRFECNGDLDDVEQFIAALRRAVELTPEGHADKPMYYNNLGLSLRVRFECNGDLDDIELSIAALRRAVELTPEGHADKPRYYNNLGLSLRVRFECNGDLDDIELSIAALRRAVELTPEGHADKPMSYNNLGTSLQVRFERNGDLDDIEQSIAALRRAVELTPEGHADKPSRYNNLGNSLRLRFERNGDLDDIEQSIAALRRVVELTPEGHADKPARYSNLGSSLAVRFERNGDLDDIEQSIAARRRAVELTPDGHADKPSLYNNLGISLGVRFERTGDLDDIEQSIAALRRAVELTPDGHADKPSRYNNLGLSMDVKCRSTPTLSNFDMAVQVYMKATAQPLGSSSARLISARRCVHLHTLHPMFGTTQSLLLAHSYVVAVLPEIVWLGHDIRRHFDESAQLGELVNGAVAAAIAAGSLKQAVEWLEAGRALIWSQVLSLRTPLDDLRDAHPRLARSLQDVQQQLQQSAPTSFALDVDPIGGVVEFASNPGADRHRGHAISYDALLKEIRDCTGFEDFLRPKRFEALVPAPELMSGPVVFINVAESRSDALILTPGGELASVALPDLSLERARVLRDHWSTNLNQRRVRVRGVDSLDELEDDFNPLHALLESIWTWIVNPILKTLNLVNPIHSGRLPHITWCPTGPLTQLPLHAAGVYSDPNGPRVFDFVVSSYTPSLSALLRSAEGVAKHQLASKMLVVTQASSLPGARAEGRGLREFLASSHIESTLLEDTEGTVDAVKNVIDQYPWIHFACHGRQHSGDPTQSAFALYDGPISLATLMSTTAEDAELAFLSACQTATGDEKNPEESAHLAAGMLAVGFKGVVATLWSIGDRDAPIVVEAYYKELLELRESGTLGKGETGAAYALHEAVRVLRERVGENKFVRWAPFVHFGV